MPDSLLNPSKKAGDLNRLDYTPIKIIPSVCGFLENCDFKVMDDAKPLAFSFFSSICCDFGEEVNLIFWL